MPRTVAPPVWAALAGGLLCCAPLASADVLSVPDEYPTIQAAIDAATTGDEVVLQPGIYNETFDYQGKGLVVRSAEGPLTTRIDRNGAGGTVVTANGTPKGTRLEGIGFYVASGIMLDCDNANLVGDNLRFIGCTNLPFTIDGSSTVSLSRTQVVLGSARARISGGVVSITDSSFKSCSAGALRISGGDVSMERVQFQENVAGSGSAIEISGDAIVSLRQSTMNSNRASGSGGAISASGSFSLHLYESNFYGSSILTGTDPGQGGSAGFLYVNGGDTVIEKCLVLESECRRSAPCCTYGGSVTGGAIGAYGGSISLIESTIQDAVVIRANGGAGGDGSARGGGLYAEDCDVLVRSSTFDSCFATAGDQTAGAFGGAIFSSRCNLVLEDSNFINCSDSRGQGSIVSDDLRDFSASGCVFDGVQTIRFKTYDSSDEIDFTDCEFVSSGDLLFEPEMNGRDVSIRESDFRGSGSITLDGLSESMVSVISTNFTGMTDGGGSACDSNNTEVQFVGCLFSGNTPPSIEATNNPRMPLVASSIFCGSVLDEISGPWVDKGGNVFDSDCTVDCDADGLPDDYEIQAGLDADCNGNGLPDSCESDGDCDEDGILDSCAIADGSPDCNLNGLPDECEADCDGDGLIDVCAIVDGAEDCNADGVPDACQLASGEVADANNDGIPDPCQSLDFTGLATEIVLIEDRILDSTVPATAVCYRLYATFDDIQGSLTGVFGDAEHPLLVAAPGGFWQDPMGGDTTATVACDEMGMFPDLRYDSWLTIGLDCASDNMVLDQGIDFTTFNAGGDLTAGDGIVFITPDDSQGDAGKAGRVLLGQFTSTDGSLPTGTVNLLGQNADGTDWIAYDIGWPEPPLLDCNGNGIHDAYDLSSGTSRDCDGSGLPDECEYGEFVDCNGNGIPDLCDVADGTSGDADGDFVPDECECLGDTNRDGLVNVYDIIEVILNWGKTGTLDADVSGDGVVDGLDLSLVLQGYGACL